MSRVNTPATASAVPKPAMPGTAKGAPTGPRAVGPATPQRTPPAGQTGGGGASARPPSATGGGSAVASPGGDGGASSGAPSGMPPIDQLQGRPIGRVLTKMGKVNREQVVEALDFQKRKGGALGRILIDLGYIKETDLNIALAAQKGYEFVSLEGVKPDPDAVAAVPGQIATTNKVFPLSFDKASKRLTVVMATHENFRAL